MLAKSLEELKQQVALRERYENFIGGKWVPPVKGQYFDNISPITGKPVCQVARSTAEDIELALDAAHAARESWGRTAPSQRARLLNKVADRIESKLSLLALAETIDNGKPIRETTAADLPLAIDHFRYFAGCVVAQEGTLSEIDHDTVAYHFHEPLGVVGQIIPWNFPLLMAAWKLAPAIAAGNCVVLKPAEQTPMSIMVMADMIADMLPPGVLNIVNGFGVEAGKPLAQNKRIAKIAFTGETTTGRLIMQYATENIIPVTLELGGKSPNIFFADVMAQDDDFFDKALEGFAMFALNQGEVCTCPSRALIQKSIYDKFMERAIKRVEEDQAGPSARSGDDDRRAGLERSDGEDPLLYRHRQAGRREGADRRRRATCSRANSATGYYVKPTILEGNNKMRVFQEEIFGPVVSVTTFKTRTKRSRSPTTRSTASARACGRAMASRAYRMGRGIQAGRVWTNCYHALSGACGVRRLQAVGHRPRDAQDDARPLSADQEPARQLQPEGARLLLSRRLFGSTLRAAPVISGAAFSMLAMACGMGTGEEPWSPASTRPRKRSS